MPNTAAEIAQLIVLIACFNDKQELLLLQRKPDVHCARDWSLPGGKVEGEELPLQAAVRELYEETGLKGKRWRHLGKTSHDYALGCLNFIVFVCQCDDLAQFQPESAHAWVKSSDLENYPMPAANAKIMPMLRMPEVHDYLQEAGCIS